MARDYTTTGLLESIKRRASIPVNQSTFTATRLLAFADDAMGDAIVPMIRRHRNDHFLEYEDQTTTTSTEYSIPEEAMNRGIYNVAMLDSASRPYALVPVDFDRELDLDVWWNAVAQGTRARRAYFVRGDKLYLYPDSAAGDTLRIYFERIPNKLIETSAAGLITSIDTGTGVITCSGGVPSSISTSTPICAIQGLPGFKLRFNAVTPSNKAATTVTVSTANAALVAVGDYIALEGESPIVQIPVEAHSILAQKVACKVLEAMGDEYLPMAMQELQAAMVTYGAAFPTRIDSAPRRVFSRQRLADFVRH